jgi:MFS family permease
MATASAPTGPTTGQTVGTNEKFLFWASFFTLIAAGIGFSVRGFILKDWGSQFGFTQAELGGITGGGLIGFGVAIIFFSFFADLFGYGKIMLVAFLLHASSAVITFAATPVYNQFGREGAFICLSVGMWLFALGNGTCEAVINPLTASLFPRNKTHYLNILHAGWPLGLILGAVVGLVFKQIPAFEDPKLWVWKLGVFLVPVLLYGLMMFNRPFPKSEAKSAGVSVPSMMGTVGLLGFAVAAVFLGLALPNLLEAVGLKLPSLVASIVGYTAAAVIWLAYTVYSRFALGSLLIAFIYILHALVGYVELGTDSWITNITERVLKDETTALMAFIWTNALMFVLRFFAGPIVHRINPIGLLLASALLGTLGLYLLGQPFTNTVWLWVGAVTIYGLGKTFYWPTLLGVISERFPKGGALALGLSGGIGMLAAGLIGGPGIGYKQDLAAVTQLQSTSNDTYLRYAARDEKGELKPDGFPILKGFSQDIAPPVAGLDNAKLKVFDDYKSSLEKVKFFEENKDSADPKVQDKTKKRPVIFTPRAAEVLAKLEAAKGKPLDGVKSEVMDAYLKDYAEVEKKNADTEKENAGLPEDKRKALEPLPSAAPAAFAIARDQFDAEKKDAEEKAKAGSGKPIDVLMTTAEADLTTLMNEKAANKPVPEKLVQELNGRLDWWYHQGLPKFETDSDPLESARVHGAKTALFWTAAVPAALAVGFLLLFLYFGATGGYKQIHLEEHGGNAEKATPQ